MPLDFLERAFCPVCGACHFKTLCKLPSYSIMRCQKCLLWLLNPYITKEGMKRIVSEPEKIKKEYPMIYKYYESEVLRSNERHSERKRGEESLAIELSHEKKGIFTFLKTNRPSGKLLELGCGSGDFTRSAARGGYEASGLDFNPNSIPDSKASFTFIQADLEKTELEPHSYDIICAFDVIEHCEDLKGLLANVHSSLNRHGILAITVPNAESLLHYFCLTAHKMTFSALGRFLEGIFVISHPIYFSLLSMSRLLETSHFKIIHHYQSSTDLTKLKLNPLLRRAVRGVFALSRLCSLQNRLVIFAQKN